MCGCVSVTWSESGRQRRVTTEERLMTELLRNYDVDSRGVVNVSRTVTVNIQFLLLRVQRLVCIATSHVFILWLKV